MASIKKKIFSFFYLLATLSFIALFFFGEKNVFLFFENNKLIKSQKILKEKKNTEKNIKTEYRESFRKNKNFRKNVVKKKLYLRRKTDKVIYYDIND